MRVEMFYTNHCKTYKKLRTNFFQKRLKEKQVKNITRSQIKVNQTSTAPVTEKIAIR
jgi:hypothetical protein